MAAGEVIGGWGSEGGGRSKTGVKIRDEREKQITKIKPECNLAQPANELRNVFNSGSLHLPFHEPKIPAHK